MRVASYLAGMFFATYHGDGASNLEIILGSTGIYYIRLPIPLPRLAGLKSKVFYVSENNEKLLQRLRKRLKPMKSSTDAMKSTGPSYLFMYIVGFTRMFPKKPCFPSCGAPGITRLVDIFASGAPCQPYSPIGKRLGVKDPRAKVFKRVSGFQFYIEIFHQSVCLTMNV